MKARRFLVLATIGSLAAVALLLARAEGPAHAAVGPTPTFGQPTISGIQGNGFEQDLRLDPTNPSRVYTSAPGALSSDHSWIWHSEDGGKTFKWVTAASPTTGKPTSCGGGGDTELAVDSAGHLYFNDLTLLNFSTARSDNGGRSFTNGIAGDCNNTGVPDAVVDRQWYATDGDPTNGGTIYLVNDEIGPGAPTCGSSTGNNELVMYRSPAPLAPPSTAGVTFGPPAKISTLLGCNEGIMGNDEVSPVTHHIFVVHDDATFNHIFMGRCVAVSFLVDPSGLQCVDLPVASFPGFKTGANFPAMAIDKVGNLYVVWEQAPVDSNGYVVGDAVLRFSSSTDEGNTWSTPVTIPTGLHNHVFAWPAAGDDGRVDIAFYGTSAVAGPPVFDQNCNNFIGATRSGPDVTNGIWSLYMVQTLNGHAFSPTFTAPVLAGEHYMHKGTINTVMGGQCGDRTLGDFLQLRIGSRGEAHISYGDSNNVDEGTTPHGMYVRQNGGTGVYVATSPVSGDPILLNTTTDPSGDGTYDQLGQSSANLPNLDILNSSMSKPAAADCHPAGTPCYRVKMIVKDLSLNLPAVEVPGTLDTDTDIVWNTQWLVPANPSCTAGSPGCNEGGKNFFVYAESTGGQAAKCFSGENATILIGGGVGLTYPGITQIDPSGCSVVDGPNGSITIDVPISDVTIDALNSTLYSVTASTMTLQGPANAVTPFAGIGGSLFNVIDVARAYDANFTSTTAVTNLSLAPKTATKVIGAQHCVTATVTTAAGGPAAGKTVRFSVSGANSRSGSDTTDASGQATFCYQGIATGDDSIVAYADLNSNTSQDPGEPSDTASVTWTAPSTNCEANITNGGQITTTHGDKATFGGNAKGANGAASGQEQYTDHGPAESVDVHSTSVVSITCTSQTQATIFGQAGSVGYRIDLVDNGEPGKNDHYRIQLSNGYDSGDHKLDGGNIQTH